MKKEIEIAVPPDFIDDYEYQKNEIAKNTNTDPDEINSFVVYRRSIDARSKTPVFRLRVFVYINEEPAQLYQPVKLKHVDSDKIMLIVGSGPAGLFAAIRAIELGIKPVVFERGKDVQTRRKDLRAIQQEGIVNPDSNYCFGEGGAGTYSDGKLYTRSTKRGNVNRILNLLVQHGAQNEILIDAHPHIGSNRLPKVVQTIRETIIKQGGVK